MFKTKPILLILSVFIHSSVFAECLNTENTPADMLGSNRTECLKMAHFIGPQPSLNDEQLRPLLINPKSKESFLKNGETVHCRYHFQNQNGQSAKFRCARTNEKNQLYDSKGELVPEAHSLLTDNGEVYLVDQNNQKLSYKTKSEKNKFRKAEIMKVRYQTGDDRNVENYTSAAASRVFWALGLPAHSNYMTEKVVCFGCGPNPFRDQKQPLLENGNYMITEFKDANIEIKFDAKRLYNPTQQPWKWAELNKLHQSSTNETRIEIELLALASNFIGVTGKTDMQNAIVCTEFDKESKDICRKVYAMSHDLGAAFGSRVHKGLFRKTMPRGDLSAYINSSIFNERSCEFANSDGGIELPQKISREARDEFLKRASVLTKDNLRIIFSASRMGRLHNTRESKIGSQEKKWAEAVLEKIEEIKSAPCY